MEELIKLKLKEIEEADVLELLDLKMNKPEIVEGKRFNKVNE